jgi:hypothetical protein
VHSRVCELNDGRRPQIHALHHRFHSPIAPAVFYTHPIDFIASYVRNLDFLSPVSKLVLPKRRKQCPALCDRTGRCAGDGVLGGSGAGVHGRSGYLHGLPV